MSLEEWDDVAYYAALMIDNVIDIMDYPFPNLKVTAQARRSLGIGITDLAGHMADVNLRYSSKEGKEYMFKVAEQHMYSCIKASLRLAEERGLCSAIDRTKWPDGWLPIDTMNNNVKKKFGHLISKDWEYLRKRIISQGGLRNSVLVAMMPNESSSIATNGTNSILPARSGKLVKSNATKMTRFLVPNYDTKEQNYEYAWDIETKDLIDTYAIFQAFTDQAISADFYLDFTKKKITGKDMLKDFLYMTAMGMKTRYYVNSRTNSGSEEKKSDKTVDTEAEVVEDKGCSSGGCAL